MTPPTPKTRWYHLTPDRFFLGLLAVQVLLFLSERFQWFPFNERKGWTVLIAVAVVGLAVVVMLVWGLIRLFLRWRFQFSFRSLLLFVVAVSVPLGWLAMEMQKARRQGEAVEAILEADGMVYFCDSGLNGDGYLVRGSERPTLGRLRELLGMEFFCDVLGVVCRGNEFGDHDVKHLQGMNKLATLVLDDTQITDEGLAHLERLTKLEVLHLDGTHVTDKGLAHLEGLTKLLYLSLEDTHITDNGLAHLGGMTKLQGLILDNTQITNEGLEPLQRMTNLRDLSLQGTQIADNGLPHLKKMTKLSILALAGTHISDEGISQLQQALPNCDVATWNCVW